MDSQRQSQRHRMGLPCGASTGALRAERGDAGLGGESGRRRPGGGEDPSGGGSGSGGGFGMAACSVGAYVIRGDEVRWQPAVDLEPSAGTVQECAHRCASLG
jgi:hypothetical protein